MLYSINKHNSGSKTNNKINKKKETKLETKWRKIAGFPNYLVSNKGQVYSKTNKIILKPTFDGEYYKVTLCDNNKRSTISIHLLVARAFIKNPKKLPKVDHIDDNSLNNKVTNLRWITQSGNVRSYNDNFRIYTTILQCDLDGNIIKKWKNSAEIIEKNPTYNKKTISTSLCNPPRTAYGFIWKYETPKIKKTIKLKKDEVFKNIGVFEGNDLSTFDVSNYGTIRNNDSNRLLASTKNKKGYMIADLINSKGIRRKYKIHRLVAHVFISKSPGSLIIVNHLDKDKSNNYFKNLEWATQKNNVIHSCGKPVKMMDPETNKILMIFNSTETARSYLAEKGRTNIGACCRGTTKSSYGYKWEYLKENESLDKLKDIHYVYDL